MCIEFDPTDVALLVTVVMLTCKVLFKQARSLRGQPEPLQTIFSDYDASPSISPTKSRPRSKSDVPFTADTPEWEMCCMISTRHNSGVPQFASQLDFAPKPMPNKEMDSFAQIAKQTRKMLRVKSM
jgi:hypothetical protein